VILGLSLFSSVQLTEFQSNNRLDEQSAFLALTPIHWRRLRFSHCGKVELSMFRVQLDALWSILGALDKTLKAIDLAALSFLG